MTLWLSGCAAPPGSYKHFIMKMSDKEASNYYNTEGLCRILSEHHRHMSDPFISPNAEVGKDRRERILDLISGKNTFSNEEMRLISNRRIRQGMSELAAYCSWGFPVRSNDSSGSWGWHRQAILRNDRYLYIENGKLESWQTYN